MARQAFKLTAKQVSAMGAGSHSDGGGLYLLVKPTGARSWTFRWKKDGRAALIGLGPASDVSLAQAREKARLARLEVEAGRDPRTERERAAVADQDTRFEAVAQAYIKEFEGGWRNSKHRQQWTNTLKTYAYPTIGKMEVRAITADDLVRVLRPIWSKKNETAMRLRGRLETILDWATAKGWRKGDNPARHKGNLEHLLPKISRTARIVNHPAMPWKDVPGFLTRLATVEGLSARALELTILTAVRSNETLSATWDEIDLEAGLWTIPAERMKAGREHVVPLPSQAVSVLKAALPFRRDGGFIFPSTKRGKALSNMAMLMVLRRMELGHYVPHGFRSSFRDWLADETEIANEVAEACLAHAVRDRTERAYRRGSMLDRRKAAMQAWADYCRPMPA